jgi:circadian clock protein KaiC
VRRRQEPGIFVAFEESSGQITANAASFDWGLPALGRNKLFFLDAHLSCGMDVEIVHLDEIVDGQP